ncbi:hypothetical protein LguiA_007131 [Lonicera macranthoides]
MGLIRRLRLMQCCVLNPPGYNAGVFKQSWDLVGSYIVESVSSLFRKGRILKAGNATVVSLIRNCLKLE